MILLIKTLRGLQGISALLNFLSVFLCTKAKDTFISTFTVPLSSAKKKSLALFFTFLCIINIASAQANVSGALDKLGDQVLLICNALFIIFIVVGLIRTISKFIKQAPDAAGSLVYVLIAVALWGGFAYMQDDIGALVGGTAFAIKHGAGK